MDAVLVEAFLPISSLDAVEKALLGLGVCNISVAKVRGYSRCVDFLSRDHLTEQAKVEVFAARDDAMRVANAIREAAEPGEGVVAIVAAQAAFKVGSASGG